eukprot:772419-Amphidinium_carterae.1
MKIQGQNTHGHLAACYDSLGSALLEGSIMRACNEPVFDATLLAALPMQCGSPSFLKPWCNGLPCMA